MKAPIIVTGPDRSGTTLMFALLASHSRISMSRRTNMWRWFYGRFGDLGRPANLERCLDVMMRYHRLAQLEPDPVRITREFQEGEPTYGRLFDLFHQHHAEAIGKPRWGDKSLHTEHFADEIIEDFPEARIIHMMRDPRDRYASVSRRYQNRSKGVGSITGRWILSTRRGEGNVASHGDNYMVVRYEDLASSPERTLNAVCDFIGEDFESSMLSMRGAPEHGDEGNSSFERINPGVISTRSIGRWRSVLSDREVASIQALTGGRMEHYGYKPEPPPMSARARARFVLGQLPYDAARTTGWLIAHGRRERFGGEIPAQRLREVPVSVPSEGQISDSAAQGGD